MISASYRNNNPYSNSRNSPARRQSSRYSSERAAATSSNSNSGPSYTCIYTQILNSQMSSNTADFIYRGANKHHWAKLQSKIKQRRLMRDNISYIEDEVEIARRSMPPPPAEFLAPHAFLETAQDKRALFADAEKEQKVNKT